MKSPAAYANCFAGIAWREGLRFFQQRGRFIAALVRPLAEHGSGQVQHAHGVAKQPLLEGVQRPAEGRQAGHQMRDR